MSLDNSSCNLASLNLMKFLKDDNTFDAELFAKAVEVIITAMDISICFADFPTEAIGDTTRDYRQLGIGYANLGALLMAMGLGYDSDGGRAMAATITSLMTGVSYRRSAELAGVVGPYAGYARNADAHKRVMRKHQAANDAVRTLGIADAQVHKLATTAWADVQKVGEANGFRNAQASVLAPTGTIGFMMDCDTTGIEPDFSLVKFKKLVGGGSMQIVNQTIPRALTKLGYAEEQVEAIVAFIAEHGHVIDAPGLKLEHYEIFDTAMGARALKPMGHVRMMAATQPFLSGAISKTVNLPETATVEEIEDIYLQSWKLGLKATAVYRDNCKVGQPLADGKSDSSKADQARAGAATSPAEAEVVEKIVYRPTRKRLPKSRQSRTTSFTVGGAEGYMTSGAHDDGELGEVFLKLGKQGSTLAGVMDAFSIAVSIGLQYGVPLETYVSKFTNLSFEPAGLTDDADVRMSKSIMDYIFRRLALDYLVLRRPRDARHLLRRRAPALPRDRLATRRSPLSEAESLKADVPVEATIVEDAARRWSRRAVTPVTKPRGPEARPHGGPHLRRALREDHRHRRRLPALHDLRHQDAPRRLLLRLRGLRQHQRLQLINQAHRVESRCHSSDTGTPLVAAWLLRNSAGDREEVGRQRVIEAPGDGDRSITGVLDVVRGAEEEVWRCAELVLLFVAREDQHAARSVRVALASLGRALRWSTATPSGRAWERSGSRDTSWLASSRTRTSSASRRRRRRCGPAEYQTPSRKLLGFRGKSRAARISSR